MCECARTHARARARAHVCVCVCACAHVCVHNICSHCESYNINSIICYIIKYKTYFEAILISLDEANFDNTSEQFDNFDNASEQFEFGAHVVH